MFRYDGIDGDFAAAGLSESEMHSGGFNDNWSRVEDFGWVRLTKSPNWCIMAEQERPDVVDRSPHSPAAHKAKAVDGTQARDNLCDAASRLQLDKLPAAEGAMREPTGGHDEDDESDDEL